MRPVSRQRSTTDPDPDLDPDPDVISLFFEKKTAPAHTPFRVGGELCGRRESGGSCVVPVTRLTRSTRSSCRRPNKKNEYENEYEHIIFSYLLVRVTLEISL